MEGLYQVLTNAFFAKTTLKPHSSDFSTLPTANKSIALLLVMLALYPPSTQSLTKGTFLDWAIISNDNIP